MNYRHAYHAGNFADVLKHLVLTLVIEHLKHKPAPFRVIDTHAGTGLYDLGSVEAQKTGEWRDGIGRFTGVEAPGEVRGIMAPYFNALHSSIPGDSGQVLSAYPGSPLIARRLMRRGDVLVANELHPEDRASLESLFARDAAVKVMGLDGWTAIKSLLPPKERRGVVIVDPPFEEPGEFERLVDGLEAGLERFATGTFILWYPMKDLAAVRRFYAAIDRLHIEKILAVELAVADEHAETPVPGLAATGVVVVNPPFTLPANLRAVMPWLSTRVERAAGTGDWRIVDGRLAAGGLRNHL